MGDLMARLEVLHESHVVKPHGHDLATCEGPAWVALRAGIEAAKQDVRLCDESRVENGKEMDARGVRLEAVGKAWPPLLDAIRKLKASDSPKVWTAYANLVAERAEEMGRALTGEESETCTDGHRETEVDADGALRCKACGARCEGFTVDMNDDAAPGGR